MKLPAILCSALVLLGALSASADAVVVFNEIMYHPATNEPALEWVEFYNQNAVDVDLSGWRVAGGIDYTFPEGTIIRASGYLVVAISPATLLSQTTFTNILGPFSGRLSNSGERLELHDLNNRLMDSVRYGTDGNWPVGPDGSGVSLAKRLPNLASAPADNWTSSAQMGGTPGSINFSTAPLLGRTTLTLPVTATWRYEDSGTDLGDAWRAPGYEDTGWASGAGLFYSEDAVLPGPKTTPLAPARNTYYFRGTFQITGDPALKALSFRPFIDDGAVIYLNGTEVARFNMPTGQITYATLASSAVGNAAFTAPIQLFPGNLLAGQNVLAVELHQGLVATNAALKISPGTGYRMAWDGDEGAFSVPTDPAPAPTNAALASLGTEVFTTSNTNLASNLTDSHYGTGSSWSPAANDFAPTVVLRFNQTLALSSIAWGRDNGNTNEAACGGTCTDRALGSYTVQYTLATNPAVVIQNSSNPTNGWTTLGIVQYLASPSGFAPHLRHRFDFTTAGGNPVLATGVRLRLANTNSIDEIEVNPPVSATPDAVFGLELSTTDILPPPPKLAFNEISAASSGNFWLELINYGPSPIDLAGIEITRSGSGSPSYTFASQTLQPAQILLLSQAQLGFGAADQSKLSLYTPSRFALLDAATVTTAPRGRHPDGAGGWLNLNQPTPGASNVVTLVTDVVLNEIMYHAPPIDPVPAVTSNFTLVPITGSWRFNDSGLDLGSDWAKPGYDDSAWPAGTGLFTVNTGVLPAPANTALAPGRSHYYFRTSFDFTGTGTNLSLSLRSIVDDGAVFYLNGTEVYRVNMPTGSLRADDSALISVADADYGPSITLPASTLLPGRNVLAVEVHQVAASTGVTLNGGGLALVEEGPTGMNAPMNLARQPGAAPFVLNSLSGYPNHNYVGLTDGIYGNGNSWIGDSGNPGYAGVRFGGLFTIQSVAFGRDNTANFNDRTLGVYTLQYTRVAVPGVSTTVTGNPDTGWATIGTLSYQSAGTGLFSNPSRRHRYTFTPVDATGLRLVVPGTGINSGVCIDELEVNPPGATADIAFGAELSQVTTLEPGRPFAAATEEWIELHNRGTNAVDLSGWSIADDLEYHFPPGVVLPAQGYLVVANDVAALKTKWPELAASLLGNLSGRLGDGETVSLKDALGNTVSSMRVLARGWSDGGGSSLELIDPRADGANPEAWADSDETGTSAWQTFSYRLVAGQRYGPTLWNEFRLGLLDAGEALIDDVSVIRDPGGARQEMIQNGDFEITAGNTHWRTLGDHSGSQIILEPGNPGNHVLKISASAPARTSHNHIESTFAGNAPIVDRQTYEVSFRARWLAGSPQVGTTAYFQRLARTTLLPIPPRHGTPGAPNSRLRDNAGPLFTDLKHRPVLPKTTEPVTISVRASDPDGVVSATLNYRVNPAATFLTLPMTQQPDGTWTAVIPGQSAQKIVHFYVTAEDGLGATGWAPPRGPASRALYQVADSQGTTLPLHELRLIQLDADRNFILESTNVMSQQRLGGTLIYDRSEVFYDVGVRLHGSAASRARDGDDYISYDLEFPPSQLFRGVQGSVGIDRSGRNPAARRQDEIYIQHMFHRAALPCYYSDLAYFIAPKTLHTGTIILQLGAYNGLFVDEQFDTVGSVFNFDMTYEPSITIPNGTVESPKLPVPLLPHIGTDFADIGDDKEQYRSPFDIRHGERADDFTGIIRLCQTMGLPQALFDQRIAAALDVDEALRVAALTILCGIADIYFFPGPSAPHNLRVFTPTDGRPAQFLPWDMDFVFYADPASSILPNADFNYLNANLSKFLNNPVTRRQYFWHIYNLCQTVFNPAYMNRWMAHYGSVVGQDFVSGLSYIQTRRTVSLGQLPAAVPFAITVNGGNDFTTNTSAVTITGSGWINVGNVQLAGVTNVPPVVWTTATNWQLTVPLSLGSNVLTFLAYDRATNLLASDAITVGTSAPGGGLDTDGDGIPDAYEIANGLDRLVNDAGLDKDRDGQSNLAEYLAGTDPRDPVSFMRLERMDSSTQMRLRFHAVSSRSYSVEWKESVELGIWSKLTDVPARLTNRLELVDDPYPRADGRIYRLVTPAQPDRPGPVLLRSPRSAILDVGDILELDVFALGTGTLTYQWQLDGQLLPGATASNLGIASIQLTNTGAYQVVASDSRGVITNQPPALLVTRPQIVDQPISQIAPAGTTVTLTVSALGNSSLRYRWARDGKIIVGATNPALVIENVQPDHTGAYRALVSHLTPLGEVGKWSSNAVLEVR